MADVSHALAGGGNQETHVLVAADQVVHVGGRVLVELLVVAEDEDCDIDGAQDGELMRLLEQAALSLEEGSAARQSQSRSRGEGGEGGEGTHTLSGCGHP